MKKYCETFRKLVLEFIEKPSKMSRTDRIKQATELFNVSRRTIYYWIENRKERGNLKDKKGTWSPRKINDAELLQYVQENPDKYLREMAVHFGVSEMTVQRRLVKMGITRKKKRNVIEKETLKKLKNI